MDRLSNKLPFATRIDIPDTVRGAELDIAFAAPDGDVALDQAERLFELFAVAADAGMFAGETRHPSESLFRVNSRQRHDREIHYRCTVRGIDRGAFRVLLNVAAEIARRGELLTGVAIRGDAAAGPSSGLSEILTRSYPGRANVIPFELVLSDFFFENREPLIRMEFRREPTDEEFEELRSMVEAWDHLLMLGGYLDPADRDGDLLPEPGEFVLVEPLVIEHLLYAYQGPAAAFDAVINMAVKLHTAGRHLTRLEIE